MYDKFNSFCVFCRTCDLTCNKCKDRCRWLVSQGLRKDGAAAHPWDWVAEDSFYVARPLCLLFFPLEKKRLKKKSYSSAAVKP